MMLCKMNNMYYQHIVGRPLVMCDIQHFVDIYLIHYLLTTPIITRAYSASVCCGQMAGWPKMPLGMEVGLGPGDFVFDGDPAAPRKGQVPTQFLAHVYCGQTAGWIKMPLGMKVDLGPSDVVLDGVAATPLKGTRPPVFGSCLLSVVAKRPDGCRRHLVWK